MTGLTAALSVGGQASGINRAFNLMSAEALRAGKSRGGGAREGLESSANMAARELTFSQNSDEVARAIYSSIFRNAIDPKETSLKNIDKNTSSTNDRLDMLIRRFDAGGDAARAKHQEQQNIIQRAR
jgi:hypothetical protein